MQKPKTTSWGGVADWYAGLLKQGPGTYQYDVILPNLLRRLMIKPDMQILDLACGPGFFAHAFSKAGADVVASDISPELIAIAKKQKDAKAVFHVSPADAIPFLKNKTVDQVTIVLAIQNIKNMPGVFAECSRVLKDGGRLHLVINHPSFRVPKASDWGWDEAKKIEYRRVEKYLNEISAPIQMHPGEDPDELTLSFHRPLQTYVKALAKNGLAISWLEEWISNRKSNSGPRMKAENAAKAEIPLFMYIEATKCL